MLRWLKGNQVEHVLIGAAAEAIRGRAGAEGPVSIVPAPYGRNFDRLSRALTSAHVRMRVDGESVVVNRGWIEAGRTRDALPEVRTPAGQVRVEGLVLERLPRVLNLDQQASGKVRQSLEIGAFAAQTGLRLRPYFLEQHSAADDGLLRDWPRPDAGVAMHESYSLQWYSFAALTVILLVALSFRRVA